MDIQEKTTVDVLEEFCNNHSQKRDICFTCQNDQIPAKLSIFSLNSNQLDASTAPSRVILFNILLKALDIKKLEVYNLFVTNTNTQFPFCKSCLDEVIEIIKIKQKIAQFEKDVKILVDGLKNRLFSTSTDDADKIFKDNLKNEDDEDNIDTSNACVDDLRNIFRKVIIIDIKNKEFLAQKISDYKNLVLKNIKNQVIYSKRKERERLVVAKLKANLLKSSSQTQKVSESKKIAKNSHLDISLEPNNAISTETDISQDGQFQMESAKEPEPEEVSIEQNSELLIEYSPPPNEQFDTFDESYFSSDNDRENNSSANNNNKERQYSVIPYKDFQTDYEKECSKNKVDNRKKRARRDSEEIPEIPEVFGSVPTSLTGNREGKLFYESYEIKCILEDPDNPKVQCVTCSKLFDVNQIKKKVQHTNPFIAVIDHIRAYHIGEFKCNQCNLMFKTRYILYLHVKNSVAHQPATATCEVCGMPSRKLSIKSIYRRHLWTHKSQEEKDELIEMGETEPSVLTKKYSKKKKIPCPTCGKLFRKNELRGHINAHLGKFYKCEQCQKKFNDPSYLKKHVRNEHENPDQHFCKECNKSFSTKQLFNNHKHFKTCTICDNLIKKSAITDKNDIYSVHVRCLKKKEAFFRIQNNVPPKKPTLPPPVTCNKCGRVFASQGRLNIHLATIHEPEARIYACTYCKKKYHFESQLNLHLNRHTKQQKFPCPHCGRIKYSKRHVIMHQKVCSKRFKNSKKGENVEKYQASSSSSQVKKLKTDEPTSTTSLNKKPDSFSPNVASSTNRPLDNLRSSEPVDKMKQDVKPNFQCKYCISRFFSHKELLDHYVEVHKKKVFNCDACILAFMSKEEYNKHTGTIFHEKNTKKSD